VERVDPDANEAVVSQRIATIRPHVLGWANTNLRDLPWRKTRDPWAILVSEVMSQQTQVARVAPKWLAFLAAYPDPSSCAAAALPGLLDLWQGLGYPRRAIALRAAAIAIDERFHGAVPSNLNDLVALPGVGGYTARALLAFAFEQDVGVVDTNSSRVIARALIGAPLPAKSVQLLADRLVPVGSGWRWNQAMLDLGARHCTKRSPDCENCPLSKCCVWRARVLAASASGQVAPTDPALFTAGVSGRQSPFDGSDRQGRGRLLRSLARAAPIHRDELSIVMGWPGDDQRAYRVAQSLLSDGLINDLGDGWFTLGE
jgi:A/G-specific adenine glycosylase